MISPKLNFIILEVFSNPMDSDSVTGTVSPAVLRQPPVTCGSSFCSQQLHSLPFPTLWAGTALWYFPHLLGQKTLPGKVPPSLVCSFVLFSPVPAISQFMLAGGFWSVLHCSNLQHPSAGGSSSLCRLALCSLSPTLQTVHFLSLCLYLQALGMKFLLVVCLVFSFTTKEQKTLLDLL